MNLDEKPLQRSREAEIATFQYLAAAIFLWLLSGFWQLQVQSPEIYAQKAEQNRVKSLPTLAPRGKILDRDGRILVNNMPSFSAMLTTNKVQPANLPAIAEGLGLPLERLEERIAEVASDSALDRIILKENLSAADMAFLDAHRSEFREVDMVKSQRRLYSSGGVAAHVVGYVGEISANELNLREFVLYNSGAEIGKAGIERQYNDLLAGTDGSRRVLVDSRGRSQGVIDAVEAQPGHNLRLTVDLELQAVAEMGLEGYKGSVIALDPRNGEVLAMASAPVFSANAFVAGLKTSEWTQILEDPAKPLLNRAIQGQWAPGSVFKPIVALAALENGLANTTFRTTCTGSVSYFDHVFHCHARSGHGSVGLQQAMMQSCDIYFYELGRQLGVDVIGEYARRAGFGAKTLIDIPNELEGIVPSIGWKVRLFRERWYAGETIQLAIGQGALTVTPLQVAHAIGGLAMGGVWHRPHLVSQSQLSELRPGYAKPEPREALIKSWNSRIIRQAMWGVVNGGGTGARAWLADIDVCGKTGTAQRVSNQTRLMYDRADFEDDAWFVGYAPCRDPEIVVVALLENGVHSYFAAPVARDVIKAYFDKKKRLAISAAPATVARLAERPQ